MKPSLIKSFYSTSNASLKATDYFNSYIKIFEIKRKERKLKLLEFGVLHGGSLEMWRDFFGKDIEIFGVDLNPTALNLKNNKFNIYILDQTDEIQLKNFFVNNGPFDIIIDDGAHTNSETVKSFLIGIEHLGDNGIYIIEDTHTSFDKEYLNPSRYSIHSIAEEISRNLSMSFESMFETKKMKFGQLCEKILSVDFYPSLIVFNLRGKSNVWKGQTSIVNREPVDNRIEDFRNVEERKVYSNMLDRSRFLNFLSQNLFFRRLLFIEKLSKMINILLIKKNRFNENRQLKKFLLDYNVEKN